MRKVCRKGRPAPAQTAGSHHSEKTELLVWHFPRTRPFPRLPFSVGKLETPSGGEDPVITGALRKLRSLLLPKEQNFLLRCSFYDFFPLQCFSAFCAI